MQIAAVRVNLVDRFNSIGKTEPRGYKHVTIVGIEGGEEEKNKKIG